MTIYPEFVTPRPSNSSKILPRAGGGHHGCVGTSGCSDASIFGAARVARQSAVGAANLGTRQPSRFDGIVRECMLPQCSEIADWLV